MATRITSGRVYEQIREALDFPRQTVGWDQVALWKKQQCKWLNPLNEADIVQLLVNHIASGGEVREGGQHYDFVIPINGTQTLVGVIINEMHLTPEPNIKIVSIHQNGV